MSTDPPTPTGTPGAAGATVAAHDIARLADVGRAAVSNWRRRFPDFPQPVGGTSASPLYSLADVEQWLTRHGKAFQLSPADRVWQQIRGTVDELRLAELIGYLGAFLIFLRRQPARWPVLSRGDDAALAAELGAAVGGVVPELPAAPTGKLDPDWVGIVRQVADAAAEQDHQELYDFLCDRYLQVHSRRHAAITPDPTAALMADLADVDGASVFDPACGIGTLLRAAHAGGAADLRGQEIDGTVAQLAAVRLLLLQDAPARVVAADSLLADGFADERFDVVLCNPPFNERAWGYDELTGDPRWEYGLPPRSEPELAWAQHCLWHVRPGGRVLLLMPASVAARRAGRRIRGNLLRAGALRAVVSFAGTGPATVPAPDLWVLRRPEAGVATASHVLMVDAAADPAAAVAVCRSFDAGAGPGAVEAGSDGVRHRAVRIIDLLDDEVDLSPLRHLTGPAGSAAARDFATTRDDLRVHAADLTATLPELAATVVPVRPVPTGTTATNTVGELVKAGLVSVHQAPLKTVAGSGDSPLLTVDDVVAGRPATGSTAAIPGSVVVAAGDVVVPVAGREPAARVLDSGGAVLGPQLLLFRVDPARVDPYFLAGFLRAAQSRTGGAVRSSSALARTDARRVVIPRLPLAEQRGYGEAFRRLVTFEDSLRRTVSLGEALLRQGFAGLADGTLRPPSTAAER